MGHAGGRKWAVSWLAATGSPQLRLRWSSRSRDGRARRDGLAPSPVVALADGEGQVILGCKSGYVASWTDEAGLQPARCDFPESGLGGCDPW